MEFLLRLDFGLEFVFMELAGILNEILLRLEMKRWLRQLRGWRRVRGRGAAYERCGLRRGAPCQFLRWAQ